MNEELILAHLQKIETSLDKLGSEVEEIKTSTQGRMAYLFGIDGQAGALLLLTERITAIEKKAESLNLSRAMLAGALVASGGVGGLIAKLLFV